MVRSKPTSRPPRRIPNPFIHQGTRVMWIDRRMNPAPSGIYNINNQRVNLRVQRTAPSFFHGGFRAYEQARNAAVAAQRRGMFYRGPQFHRRQRELIMERAHEAHNELRQQHGHVALTQPAAAGGENTIQTTVSTNGLQQARTELNNRIMNVLNRGSSSSTYGA